MYSTVVRQSYASQGVLPDVFRPQLAPYMVVYNIIDCTREDPLQRNGITFWRVGPL